MKSPKELREISERNQYEADKIQGILVNISTLLDQSAADGKFGCEFNTTYLNNFVLNKIISKLTEMGFQTTESVYQDHEHFERLLKISF